LLRRLPVCNGIRCRAIDWMVKLASFSIITKSSLHVELHWTSKMRKTVELVEDI
jgi:hypothetical protein